MVVEAARREAAAQRVRWKRALDIMRVRGGYPCEVAAGKR